MMSKNRLYTIAIIVLAAILSLGATITGIVVSRREFSKLTGKSECVTEARLNALKGVLNNVCAFNNILNVKYDVNVNCDQNMTKPQTSNKPTVTLKSNLKQGRSYTLLMVDPDAPESSVEELIFYLHWAVAGISPEELTTGMFPEGLIEYMGPFPPKNQFHRYQFIVFEENKGSDVSLRDSKRGGFKMADFLKGNNLCVYVGLFQFKLKDEQ